MIRERVRQTHGQILSPYDGRNCWVLYLLDSHYADEGLGENYHHKILTMDIISSAINNNGSGQASFVNLCLWSPGGRLHVILRLKARTWSQRVLNDLLKHRQVACDTLQHELPQGTEENVAWVLMFPRRRKSYSRVHSDHGLLDDYVGFSAFWGLLQPIVCLGHLYGILKTSSVYSNIGVEGPKQL